MTSLHLSIALAAAAVLAPPADTGSLSGKWQVHTSIAGYELDQECTFTHKDKDLTGNCSSNQGSVQISGKVEEKKVTWAFKSSSGNSLAYEGTLDPTNGITGMVSVKEYGIDGNFTATQSK